jgi:hypothetical protein
VRVARDRRRSRRGTGGERPPHAEARPQRQHAIGCRGRARYPHSRREHRDADQSLRCRAGSCHLVTRRRLAVHALVVADAFDEAVRLAGRAARLTAVEVGADQMDGFEKVARRRVEDQDAVRRPRIGVAGERPPASGVEAPDPVVERWRRSEARPAVRLQLLGRHPARPRRGGEDQREAHGGQQREQCSGPAALPGDGGHHSSFLLS